MIIHRVKRGVGGCQMAECQQALGASLSMSVRYLLSKLSNYVGIGQDTNYLVSSPATKYTRRWLPCL